MTIPEDEKTFSSNFFRLEEQYPQRTWTCVCVRERKRERLIGVCVNARDINKGECKLL